MGGGCACNSSIKKYFFCSADYVINQENKKDNSQIDLVPEKNMKIIQKEDIDFINNNIIQNPDKIKIKANKNDISNISNINNKTINDDTKNIFEDKINISNNINNNSSIYLSSDNQKKNNNENTINNNKINSNKDNLGPKHKAVQQKIMEKEKLKKTDTYYNYNLGEHNFIFINISRGSSVQKNDSEKYESTTPKMAMEKENLDEMAKGSKRIFSHFYINKKSDKPSKNQSNENNQIIRPDYNKLYMNNYSEEMLKAINELRTNPQSFIQYIDSMINNNIQRKNDDIFIISQNVDEKIKLMEDYLLIFDQIKRILKDIINSKIFVELEELKYNEELEIDIERARAFNMSQSHMERSSVSNEKYLSNINHSNLSKKKKKIDYNSTLDLSDDKIANLILEKRKEIKDKYPDSIFKLNIIKDININILIQISMELVYDQYNSKKMLNEIIFNPKYKNFAVSWANELNRKFISISCFA